MHGLRTDCTLTVTTDRLTRHSSQRNVCFAVMLKGIGTVQFETNPLCDLTNLQPQEYYSAFYMGTDYTEGYAHIAYDYLTNSNSGS